MPDGRGARLALEAGFLVAVAAAAAYAQLRPGWIVVAMLAGWLIVALLEWVSWREVPHWGSGQPPRYHVPARPLPPRPPSVELPVFSTYPRPAPRESEAATWIATPEMREALYGWSDEEDEPSAPEPQTTVEELSEELLAEAAGAAEERAVAGWPVPAPLDEATEAWPEPTEAEQLEHEPEPEGAQAVDEPPAELAPAAAPSAPVARHRLDPYAEPARRRRLRRRRERDAGVVELAAVPPHERVAEADRVDEVR